MPSIVETYLNNRVFEGDRDNALNRAAFCAAGEGWQPSEIRQTFLQKAMNDGLTKSEAMKTIESALRAARREGLFEKAVSKRKKKKSNGDEPLAVNAVLGREKPAGGIPEPGKNWERDDLQQFLEALFQPGEYISYNSNYQNDGKGKLIPAKWGVFNRTAGDMLAALKNGNTATGIVGPGQAGTWVRLNPMDGQGPYDRNVSAFRHGLVEFDTVSIEEQWEAVNSLGLPVSTVVHSGGKSLHFSVRIDAQDKDEFRWRMRFLYDYLKQEGYSVDTQNLNPSRLSRLPGVVRAETGKPQYLLTTNIGFDSWDEWYDTVKDEKPEPEEEKPKDDPIEPADVSSWLSSDPEPQKYLFEDVVPTGIITGLFAQGGTGKGWLTEMLIISACTGRQLFDAFKPVDAMRVLWIESEDTADDFPRRARKVAMAYNLGVSDGIMLSDNLKVFAGQAFPLVCTEGKMVKTTPRYRELLDIIKEFQPRLIVIDPLAHFIACDENSNTELSAALSLIRQLAFEVEEGASVWINHHTAKGKGLDETSDAGRGASAIRDSIRSGFNLVPVDPKAPDGKRIDDARMCVKLLMTKANYTERMGDAIYFRRETGATGGVLRQFNAPTYDEQPIDNAEILELAVELAEIIGENKLNISLKQIFRGTNRIRKDFADKGYMLKYIKAAYRVAIESGLIYEDVVPGVGDKPKRVPRRLQLSKAPDIEPDIEEEEDDDPPF